MLRHGFAPDPALPARDLLLDPAAVTSHLGVGSCATVRVKYRIGESLRVTYRIDAELITVRAFRRGADARAAARGGGRYDAVLHAVWWTFPDDRRLRGLGDLFRAAPGRPWTTADLVEYAAERTATVRALDAAGRTAGYAKAYAPGTVDVADRAARYTRIAAALGRDAIASPRALGCWPHRHVLLLEPMPGVRWGDLATAALPAALSRLGRAIATLHRTTPVRGLGRFGRLGVDRVVHSAQLVALARPDVAGRVTALADRLAAAPRRGGDEPVTLHGDCHPKNALVDGDAVALIDLDQAGVGPAAADLGSLLARLRQDGDTGELAAAFLAGYRDVRALPDETSLRWHTAAALVAERAVRAVNRVHLPTLDRLGDLLASADETLLTGVPT